MRLKRTGWLAGLWAVLCLAGGAAAQDLPPENLTAKQGLEEVRLVPAELQRIAPMPVVPLLDPIGDATLWHAQYGQYKAREKQHNKALKKQQKAAKKQAKQTKKKYKKQKPGKINPVKRKSASKSVKARNYKSADKARKTGYKKSEAKLRTGKSPRSKYTGPAKQSKPKKYKGKASSGRAK